MLPTRVGHYLIDRKLGEGGMGVVYAARDERLERSVALKMMLALGSDDTARKRFWREARAAASVNHPNVCQIYEIGEDAGELFIAMELLEGEVLAERLRRGPMSAAQVVPLGLGMLAALSALHARGIVHRDLKPSNVFLTSHGVKLLDFGLARPEVEASLSTETGLTRAGVLLGTPRYMAPEQIVGEPADTRSDLFAVGAILFEMLAGRPAFGGRTAVEVLHATRYEQPPALTGSPAVAAVDRVIRRALAKRPSDRPVSADAMAEELEVVRGVDSNDGPALAHTLTRVVVLPFRVLKPDPETDFLAFSLPDAITTSLSATGSLILRSSAVAARFGDAPDLKALASDADVDRVVMGTLLRSGDQLRATAQLVEAPVGTLITSHTVQSSMGDLFRLQDDIARRVVEALSPPLSGTPSPAPDGPHDPRAYELYLRANGLARTYEGLAVARDLYQQCLELDPRFASAWAQLGRCHRVLGKYIEVAPESETRAEEAFRRALGAQPAVVDRAQVLRQPRSRYRPAAARPRSPARRSRRGTATIRSSSPGWFTPAATVACTTSPSPRTSRHAGSIRTSPTSLDQTLLMTGDVDRLVANQPPAVIARAGTMRIRVDSVGGLPATVTPAKLLLTACAAPANSSFSSVDRST